MLLLKRSKQSRSARQKYRRRELVMIQADWVVLCIKPRLIGQRSAYCSAIYHPLSYPTHYKPKMSVCVLVRWV
jgi:hypothetical protein